MYGKNIHPFEGFEVEISVSSECEVKYNYFLHICMEVYDEMLGDCTRAPWYDIGMKYVW